MKNEAPMLNPSDAAHDLKLSINGAKLASGGRVWSMAPAKVDATINVGETPEVEVLEQDLTAVPDTMSVPPFSISIYSYPVQ